MAQKEIKAELTCPVCMELYRQPRRLPCGHAYCHQCIANLLAHNAWSSRNLMCPECREIVRLDYVLGIEALPLDFKLSRLVEIMGFLETNDSSSNSDDNESPQRSESSTVQRPCPSLAAALNVSASATPALNLPTISVPLTSSASSNAFTTTTTTTITSAATATNLAGDSILTDTDDVDNSQPTPTSSSVLSNSAPTTTTSSRNRAAPPTLIPLIAPPGTLLGELAPTFDFSELTDFSLPRTDFDDYLDTLTYSELWREAEILLFGLGGHAREGAPQEEQSSPPDQQQERRSSPPVAPALADVPSRPLSSLSSSSSSFLDEHFLSSSLSDSDAHDDDAWLTLISEASTDAADEPKVNADHQTIVHATISSSVDSRDIAVNASRADNSQTQLPTPENKTSTHVAPSVEQNQQTDKLSSDSANGNCVTPVGVSDSRNPSSDSTRFPVNENNAEINHVQPSPPPFSGQPWQGVSSTLLRLGDILTANSSPEGDRLGYSADNESDEEREVDQDHQNSGILEIRSDPQHLSDEIRFHSAPYDCEINPSGADPNLLDAVIRACHNRQQSRNIRTGVTEETSISAEGDIVSNSTSDTFKSKYQKLKKKVVNLFRDSFSSSDSSEDDDNYQVDQEQEVRKAPNNVPQRKLEREKRKWRMTRRLMSLILSDDGSSSSSEDNTNEERRAQEILEKSSEEKMEKDIDMDWLSDDSSDGFFGFLRSKKSKKAGRLVRNDDKDDGGNSLQTREDNETGVEGLNASKQSLVVTGGRRDRPTIQNGSEVVHGAVGVDNRNLPSQSTNYKPDGKISGASPTQHHTELKSKFDYNSRRSPPQETNFPVPYIPPYSSHYDNYNKADTTSHGRGSGVHSTVSSTTPTLIDARVTNQVNFQAAPLAPLSRQITLYDNVPHRPIKQTPSNSVRTVQTKPPRSRSNNTRPKLPHSSGAQRQRPNLAEEGLEPSPRGNISQAETLKAWRKIYQDMSREGFGKSRDNNKDHSEFIAADLLRRLCRQQYNYGNESNNNSATCRPEIENLKEGPSTNVCDEDSLYSDEFMNRLRLDPNPGHFSDRRQEVEDRGNGVAEIENLKEDGCVVQSGEDMPSNCGQPMRSSREMSVMVGEPMISMYDNVPERERIRYCHVAPMATGMRRDDGGVGLREEDGRRAGHDGGHHESRTRPAGESVVVDERTAAHCLNERGEDGVRRPHDGGGLHQQSTTTQCGNTAVTVRSAATNAVSTNVIPTSPEATDVKHGAGCDGNNNNDKIVLRQHRSDDNACGGRTRRSDDEDDNFLDEGSAMLKSIKKPKSRFRKFISSLMWVSSSSSDDDDDFDYTQYQNSKSPSSSSNFN